MDRTERTMERKIDTCNKETEREKNMSERDEDTETSLRIMISCPCGGARDSLS